MASTTTVRYWWRADRCKVGDKITLFGKSVYLQPEAHDAGYALERALYDYGTVQVLGSHRWCPTGISGKTCQPSGTSCSLHNYSIALDFDPFKYGNPHLQRKMTTNDWKLTKFTKAQVARVEKIRTKNGKQVWRWLGEIIGDTMHFEITCSPADLATGINWDTVPGGQIGGEDQVIDRNSPKESPAVAMFQRDLILLGYNLGDWAPIQAGLYPKGADGSFGTDAENGCKAFQADLKLQVTGKGDALTVAMAANLARFSERAATSTVDTKARQAAATAQGRADSAHTRLEKLKSI